MINFIRTRPRTAALAYYALIATSAARLRAVVGDFAFRHLFSALAAQSIALRPPSPPPGPPTPVDLDGPNVYLVEPGDHLIFKRPASPGPAPEEMVIVSPVPSERSDTDPLHFVFPAVS